MRRLIPVALTSLTILNVAFPHPVHATTFDLPLDGSISIINNTGSPGPVAIEIQAVESFSLPVFNQQNPQTTVGVYQWIASFSVFDQSGSQVSEPGLSPFGTALTGYGQNCSVIPYCPRPSGPSSETILSGTLFIPGNATLDMSTIISGLNIVSENLELLLTLPDGFSTNPPLVDPPPPGTPLPATLPLFATGLGLVGLFGWRKRSKVAKPFTIARAANPRPR
jgi:hypothetical protein